jgi:hypothetical protein
LVGVPLGLALFACTRAIPTLEAAAIAALAGFASVALLGLLARLVPLLTTDDRGVGGFDFWFRQHHITWAEISRVAEFKFPGFPCLRIFSATSRWPVWAPIALAHPDKFISAVAAHTEMGHPLRRYLEGGAA